MTDTRVCKGCKVEKAISEFRVIRNSPLHKCRDCGLDYNRKYMRAYREKRTADRRTERLAEMVAKPNGRPSYNQRLEAVEAKTYQAQIDAINIKLDAVLAILDRHGYNTTET